jgi:hypothetical protein
MKTVTQVGIGHVLRCGGKYIDRYQASSVTLPLYNGNCLTNINAHDTNKLYGALPVRQRSRARPKPPLTRP